MNDVKLVQQLIRETSGFDNTYYEICNEPGGGAANHVAPEGVDAWQREMPGVDGYYRKIPTWLISHAYSNAVSWSLS